MMGAGEMVSRVKIVKSKATFHCSGCGANGIEKLEGGLCQSCSDRYVKQDWTLYDDSWGDYDSDPVNPDTY